MGVHTQCEPNVRVAEPSLARLRVDSSLCEDGRIRSPQVVELQVRKLRPLACGKPYPPSPIREVDRTVRCVDKDERVGLFRDSFGRYELAQLSDKVVGKGNDPVPCRRLHRAQTTATRGRAAHDLLIDAERPRLEVDASLRLTPAASAQRSPPMAPSRVIRRSLGAMD